MLLNPPLRQAAKRWAQSMRPTQTILFLLFFAIGCASLHSYRGLPRVDVCNLAKREGDTVYVEGTYSGVVEYWSFGTKGGCRDGTHIELDNYIAGKPVPMNFTTLVAAVYMNSHWAYLKLKLVGVYESKRAVGYGHLGSNKARFIVTEYVDVELVDSQGE